MALTKKFADEFTHNAQHEGARIFWAGGVKFEDRLRTRSILRSKEAGPTRYSLVEKGVVHFLRLPVLR